MGTDGAEHRPVMIHRAMLGSLERFFGILIEHTAGSLPLWLSPVQAVILPVSEKFSEYSERVAEELRSLGVRIDLDSRNEKLGYKIREAQLQKVPYMLVVGGREADAGTVSVRVRNGEDRGSSTPAEFGKQVLEFSRTRTADL